MVLFEFMLMNMINLYKYSSRQITKDLESPIVMLEVTVRIWLLELKWYFLGLFCLCLKIALNNTIHLLLF
jgi:hypothetical protein